MNSHSTSHFNLPLFIPHQPRCCLCIYRSLTFLKFQDMMNDYAKNNNNNNTTLVGDMNGVVCPKPRRFNPSIISISSPRSHDHHYSIHQTEMYETNETKTKTELLDMILTKEFYDVEKTNNLVSSSPPYFCGSPPSRASNPVVQDVQFGNKDTNPFSPVFEASPSSSARKSGGSCARGQFGQKRPTVRVEGFKCRGISAVA